MQHVVLQVANTTVEHDVLVDLAVVVATQSVAKQAQIPAGVPTGVAYPGAEKNHASIQVVAIVSTGCDGAFDLALQFRRDALVGVDDQHPVVAKRQSIQRPVLLTRVALERVLHNCSAMSASDLDRS